MVPHDSLEIKLLREKMEQLLVDNDPVGHTNNRMIPIDNLVLIFSGALWLAAFDWNKIETWNFYY